MSFTREHKAKLNIATSLLSQIVVIICGLLVPRLLLTTFGSELYGATTSIAQFLSYISLLEGGIAGVARAELYSPLASGDYDAISGILQAIQRFFVKIGLFFLVYVLIIACGFKGISSLNSLDWISSFWLVIVISLSTLAQYFIGISFGILLQADQRLFIVNIVTILTTILNTLLIVVSVILGANIIIVKLVSSIVFVLRPIAYFIYVKRRYPLLAKCKSQAAIALENKWTGLGQHIAYFLHSNVDVVLLTFFVDLEHVAVYSVYSLIISNMQSLISSFGSGMESLFGEMYAKREKETLLVTFGKYEGMLSFVSVVALSTTMALILPFVKLYTFGVNDTNYIHPIYAVIMMLASYFYLVRLPYHNMVIAAGHFKQTRMAAYGEALINIACSLVLVINYGLVGVAVGTLAAVLFRYIFYVIYVSKKLLEHRISAMRIILNLILLLMLSLIGYMGIIKIEMQSYVQWVEIALIDFLFNMLCSLGFYQIFMKSDIAFITEMMHKKLKRRE